MYERQYKTRVLKTPPPTPRIFVILKRVGIALAIGLFVWGVVACLRYHKFQIQNVAVSGTFVIDPHDVETFAQNTMQGNYLRVIPKTSIFVLRPNTLAARIKKQFPYIQTIEIHRQNMSSISIAITEYKGVYVWCTDTEEQCFFMNKNGLVFSPSPYFSGSAYIKLFGRQDGKTNTEVPFEPYHDELFAHVPEIIRDMPIVGITPVSFTYQQEHSLAISFMHNGTMAQLFIDPTKDILYQIQALSAALNTEALGTSFDDTNKTLVYLDTRFDGKVVYKFK
ncbi:MAG: FtsQ-type POTRA domain-containing protein [bacterium]